MGYYDNERNVEIYLEMSKDVDSSQLIEILKRFLPRGSTLLELGMGPGRDFEVLETLYLATGSDLSQHFLNRYRKHHKDTDLVQLDARSMDTDKRYDGIYSNKVLMHMTRQEMKESLLRQAQALNPGGIVFHTFWKGSGQEEFDGLLFTYYMEDEIIRVFNCCFDVIEIGAYAEEKERDSIYVVARRR